MAGAVAERAWRDAAPDEIEPALSAVWREIGSHAPTARAVMSNLVIVRGCAAEEPLDAFAGGHAAAIEAVAARHPSRLIVIAHEPQCPLKRAPIAARVSVTTFGPPQARYGVEQISVRSACDASSLPSIVRRLVRGGLPTSVWWMDDLSRQPPLGALATAGRQLLFDSRRWSDMCAGARALVDAVAETTVDLADLNWRRLAPVRRALRHAGDALPLEDLRHARVRIAHAPGEAALAVLLRAWLASTFGWTHGPQPEVSETGDGTLLTLAVGEASRTSTIELTSERVRVAQHGWPPYIVGIPIESAADAVAAELRNLAADAALRAAIGALAGITSEASS